MEDRQKPTIKIQQLTTYINCELGINDRELQCILQILFVYVTCFIPVGTPSRRTSAATVNNGRKLPSVAN